MKFFAGLVTYLTVLVLLLGAAFIGVAAFLHEPVDADGVALRPQPLVRAADRKRPGAAEEKKAAPVTKAAPATAAPQQAGAELAKKQAKVAPAKKAKPKFRSMPEMDETSALGFAAPPRSFNSPFFR